MESREEEATLATNPQHAQQSSSDRTWPKLCGHAEVRLYRFGVSWCEEGHLSRLLEVDRVQCERHDQANDNHDYREAVPGQEPRC